MHIFIAGFQHETNTFAASRADWVAFTTGATFLAASRGDELRDKLQGANLPAAGFLHAAESAGHTCTLGFWAGATPSGFVTTDAFERIASSIVADLQACINKGPMDAVYLDLHGAAVAEHLQDCEGELLEHVRAVVGPHMPLVVSLDLHANVSERMLALACAVVSYRKYPHTDMAETGALAFTLLQRRMALSAREPMAFGRLPHLISLVSQSTWMGPAKAVYAQLVAQDAALGTVSSFCPGFPASDIAECAPCFWSYGQAAQLAVDGIAASLAPPEQWRLHSLPPAQAVAAALQRAEQSANPVLIADVQDNPGAGGDSCTTGVLIALLQAGAGKRHPGQVALGLLYDPDTATAAHAAGVGAVLHRAVGQQLAGFDGSPTDATVRGKFTVRALHDGNVTLTGPMLTGAKVSLGLCAALEIDGVLVAVSSQRKQMLDRGLFQFLGIEPANCKLLVVKSSNHYRADFSPLVADAAQDIINAKAHASFAADPADLKFTQLPAGLRTTP